MGTTTALLPAASRIARQLAGAGLLGALAAGLTACAGLDSGIDYPALNTDIGSLLLTPENQHDPPIGLNRLKIAPQACEKVDTHTIATPLNQEDFTRFLATQGIKIEPRKARSNLFWYDVPNGGEAPKPGELPKNFVRLRLAVLEDSPHASADLHQSILEHGPGWWGVRRSNLALLAPKASLQTALAFALKYKLACWGMFTYGGLDDAYVVPGPYGEL